MTGKRTIRNQRGFTLMEIIITVAVFSITVVMAVDLFLSYTKLQKRASVEQALGTDARFITESIVHQFRLGTIDYDYYGDPDGDTLTADAITIGSSPVKDSNGNSVLAIVNQGAGYVRYRFQQNTDGVGRVELSTDKGISWASITPSNIDVEQIDFYLAPGVNPFELKDPIPASGSVYLSDEQPRLTIVIKTTSLNEKPPLITQFQTTVTSRMYVR